MLLLSPTRWLAAKSPMSAMLMVMSLTSCTEPKGPPFVTRSMCVSAFPYWFSPSRIVIASRSFICGVTERAEQQRYVEVFAGIRHRENNCNLWKELGGALLLEVVSGVEIQSVLAKGDDTFGQLSDAALGVGDATADDSPAPVRSSMTEGDRHAFGGAAARCIEHVRRDAHSSSMLPRRSLVILRCSSAAALSSICASLPIRCRSATSTSAAVRPVAEIRNTWPNRASYRRLNSASAAIVSSPAPTMPPCSFSDQRGAGPPLSPILGCAANASSHSAGPRLFHTASAFSMSAGRSAYGRPAETVEAHTREPQQRRSWASASSLGRALNRTRFSLNPQRHQLKVSDVDQPAIGDLQLRYDRQREEAQGYEGRGHGHSEPCQPSLHRAQPLVYLGERLVAHQTGNRQRQLLHHAPAFGDDYAAADLGQAAGARRHVGVADPEHNHVVRVVGDRGCVGAALQPEVGGEAEADPTGGVMPLEDCDLDQVAPRVCNQSAVTRGGLNHVDTGQKLSGYNANDPNPLGARRDSK